MLSLLLVANLAILTEPVNDILSERCQTRIAGRLGELGTFAPEPRRRKGRLIIIDGVVDALEKPPVPSPGMMAATHILVTRYGFSCELRAGKVRRLKLRRQEN